MLEVVLIKLGGSLLTDKEATEKVRTETLERLAAELVRGAADTPDRPLLGHGSGSFGHRAAARAGLGETPEVAAAPARRAGVPSTQDRAAALHREVISTLLAAGGAPFSFVPSSAIVAAQGAPHRSSLAALVAALGAGLLPVAYGDVILDLDWGAVVYSTERLFDLFARRLPADGVIVRRAIWLGETDGVYDPDGRLIEQLDAATLATRGSGIAGARGTDVTGGMRHRVDTAMALAALGIPSLIANGTTPGLLERALRGAPVPGTHIDAIPPTSR